MPDWQCNCLEIPQTWMPKGEERDLCPASCISSASLCLKPSWAAAPSQRCHSARNQEYSIIPKMAGVRARMGKNQSCCFFCSVKSSSPSNLNSFLFSCFVIACFYSTRLNSTCSFFGFPLAKVLCCTSYYFHTNSVKVGRWSAVLIWHKAVIFKYPSHRQ